MNQTKVAISNRVEYRLNGRLHRMDGPAIEWVDGSKEWYRRGLRHREDGPAFEYFDGHKEWYHYGVRHRIDGPAGICSDGSSFWYINGVHSTDEITQWFSETNFNPDYKSWTLEEQFQFKLIWG